MAMAKHHFSIKAPAHGRGTTIEMDGEPLTGVRSVCVTTAVDDATVVTLEFINVTADVEAEDAEAISETTQFGDETRSYAQI